MPVAKSSSRSETTTAKADQSTPVRIEDLRIITPGAPDFDKLSNMVEGAICAFQSLGSAYTLPKKLTLDTPKGPVSVLMGHTETVPYKHDPCPWCVKFRPQDLSAHEHIQVHADNRDLPTLGDESYPDVIITTPFGSIYAWEEVAVTPGLDVTQVCELMTWCEEEAWLDLADRQLQAQLDTFKRIEPEANIQMLREFYERFLASKEHDQRDLIDFVKTFEDCIADRGGITEALRYFQWISASPKRGRSIQDDLIHTYPF